MKQKLTGSALGLLALLICAVPAYPWGWAAHTYVVDHAGTKRPAANLQEIYGSLAPDTFNYLSVADPSLQPIQDLLHGETHERPFPIWENASPELKPLAYGFVSHNEAWGEDWTAHIQNLTIGGREGMSSSRRGNLPAYCLMPCRGRPAPMPCRLLPTRWSNTAWTCWW